jgi:hypothetical protein
MPTEEKNRLIQQNIGSFIEGYELNSTAHVSILTENHPISTSFCQ